MALKKDVKATTRRASEDRHLAGSIRHQQHLAEQREEIRARQEKKRGRKNRVRLIHFDRGAVAVSALTCGDCKILVARVGVGMRDLEVAFYDLGVPKKEAKNARVKV